MAMKNKRRQPKTQDTPLFMKYAHTGAKIEISAYVNGLYHENFNLARFYRTCIY